MRILPGPDAKAERQPVVGKRITVRIPCRFARVELGFIPILRRFNFDRSEVPVPADRKYIVDNTPGITSGLWRVDELPTRVRTAGFTARHPRAKHLRWQKAAVGGNERIGLH